MQEALGTSTPPAPPLGAAIYTEDGRHIGAVTEVRGSCFKVGQRWHLPYWLPLDALEAVDAGRVTLLVPAAWLNDCKRDAPRAA
jgi:hypothetical protein